MSSGVDILGGRSLSDYFLGFDTTTPTVAAGGPITMPASITNTMTLDQAQQLSNAWMSEPISYASMAEPVKQPSFWEQLWSPFAEAGSGLISGVSEEAAGVAKGISQKLPELLLQSLFKKAGVSTIKVQGDNGKTVTYLQPSKAGVPPAQSAQSGTQISTGTVAGIATGTVLLIGVIGLIVILALRK